jgi:hypothetical protein
MFSGKLIKKFTIYKENFKIDQIVSEIKYYWYQINLTH